MVEESVVRYLEIRLRVVVYLRPRKPFNGVMNLKKNHKNRSLPFIKTVLAVQYVYILKSSLQFPSISLINIQLMFLKIDMIQQFVLVSQAD